MLSYIGGKSRISSFIKGYIPKDIETYVEPFGGMYWVFFKMDLSKYTNLKKVVYNDFIVRFKVDENMENYLEIFNWMVEIGRPEFFATGAPSPLIANDIYSNFVCDGTLLILNSANKPNIEVRFKDLFPVVIGDIEFTSSETDVSYVDVSVNFRCLSFTLHTS